MAVNAYKTNAITNLDSTPILRANPWVHGGNAKQFAGTIEAVNGDSIGSTYRFFRVGSWMRPVQFTLFCDAITSAAADLGLYRTAADGGAVVSQALFASAGRHRPCREADLGAARALQRSQPGIRRDADADRRGGGGRHTVAPGFHVLVIRGVMRCQASISAPIAPAGSKR